MVLRTVSSEVLGRRSFQAFLRSAYSGRSMYGHLDVTCDCRSSCLLRYVQNVHALWMLLGGGRPVGPAVDVP